MAREASLTAMTYMQMAEETVTPRIEEGIIPPRPVGPFHAWENGTDTVLCGRRVAPGWMAVFEEFPPRDDACPACLEAFRQ